VISLAGYTIARRQSLHIPSNLKNNAGVAIPGMSRKTRLTARLTPVYIIVYLRTYTDGCIIVSNEHAIIRHWRQFVLLQLNLPEVSIDKSLRSQGIYLGMEVQVY